MKGTINREGASAQNRPGALATLNPGYFALVMATGIVSMGAHYHDFERIALGLLWVNMVAYVVLWCLTLVRLVCHRNDFIGDLTHHSRGASFLTTAAATCVLGVQFATLTPWTQVATGLWWFGSGLAVALSYLFFIVIITREPKPSLQAGINGAWLLVVVAAESVSVLGTLVAGRTTRMEQALFISICAFLAGAMLYVFFITLILYRWLFFSMHPEKLSPDYWIDMGALAITTLAGTLLLQAAPKWKLLQLLTPFLTGASLFFWATASWWIPLLLLVEIWRHVRRRVLFRYGPDYWALVFPLGMYAAATYQLAGVPGLEFLNGLAWIASYVAFVAWLVTFAGMLYWLSQRLLSHRIHTRNKNG